jgi:alkylation response protein AidB-like acyl-CoA dehydrogenase
MKLWTKRIGEKGWGTPTWPKAYGGGGLSQAEARVLAEEMARIGARNPIQGMGPGMFGHTLLEYGNEEQKLTHFPPICRGELRWCQGFSEPGSGSDLASLTTKAEDKGDHYLVNGQKIWTSGAQFADWCFCLVRTDTTKKHEGISFLLIDMHSPGVEARPIKMISGASGQCETFFTDVKVPKENLVGALNGGWPIAKRLLQHERNGMGNRLGGQAGPRGSEPTGVQDLAKKYVGLDETGRLADADLRARLIAHKMEEQALRLTVRRAASESRGNAGPNATTSIMKNVSMKTMQDRSELTVEILGANGLGWEGEGFDADELAAVRGWLAGKAGSIYGGSHEIQNNIIAKRILNLPEMTGAVN